MEEIVLLVCCHFDFDRFLFFLFGRPFLQTLLSPNSTTHFQYTTPVRPTANRSVLNSIKANRGFGRLATSETPFSPSQFFSSPCNANGQNMATSTPVKRGGGDGKVRRHILLHLNNLTATVCWRSILGVGCCAGLF